MKSPVQAYKTNQAETATPGQLTLMLYNGAIKFTKLSKLAIEEKQYDKANEYNIRVQDIIQELMITLNRDVEISKQLELLYDYLLRRTIDANLQKDTAILDEVEDFFVQFRDTWKEALLLVKKQG